MAIEQRGFSSVQHLLLYWASLHNGHLRGPMTLTFGSEAVNKCFNDLGLSRLGFKHPTFCMRGVRSNQLRLRGGQSTSIKGKRGNQHEYRGYIYVFN